MTEYGEPEPTDMVEPHEPRAARDTAQPDW